MYQCLKYLKMSYHSLSIHLLSKHVLSVYYANFIRKTDLKKTYRDFPGSPVVKTQYFQCRGHWIPSQVGELRSHIPCNMAKNTYIYT